MLPKLSVKKPYTIVVGIVIVILLGVVSFLNMKTDLLPEMTLPYAIVYTSYPGASPEQVETIVTRPIEQAMATVSNIENVNSVSSENVSMVILEFAQSANMDSVSLDMRESLDQISGYWDDSVSNPIIMKLNPDMMPVMVAGLEAGDMTGAELSDYAEQYILPELESIEGVASVSTSGQVEEQIQVTLRQEKIDALNEKIVDSLDKKFSDAQEEIEENQRKIQDGQAQLESGQEQLAQQTGEGDAQISQGQAELIKSQVDIDNNLALIESQLAELDSGKAELEQKENELATTRSQLEDQEKQLKEGQAQLEALPAQLEELQAQQSLIDTAITALEQAPEQLKPLEAAYIARDELTRQLADLELAGGTPEQLAVLNEQITALNTQITTALAPIAEAGVDTGGTYENLLQKIDTRKSELVVTKNTLTTSIGTISETLNNAEEQKKQIQEGLSQIEEGKKQIASGEKEIAAAKKQMESGREQLLAARSQLEGAKTQIASGKTTLSAAAAQLNAEKITATIEIASGKAQLTAGETQLEAAKTQLEESKESAYVSGDATKIITLDTVKALLSAQNFSMPAGYVTEDGIDFLIRVGDKFTDAKSMEDLVLMDLHMDGVEPVKLSHVADVVVTDDSSTVYASLNGKTGMMVTMQKQSGYSTGEVSDRIKDKFEELTKSQNVHIVTLMDQGIYIDMVVESVLENMVVGAILAVLVLLLFLRDVRPTIVIAFSIPISIMGAVVLMYFSGINLNVISLSGLALGIGMLVDNSIVVIENIYRLRNEGKSAAAAAVEGARQVSGAIAASTLTTVCVFAPIIFTEGITRQLFVDMGLTIAYSLLASLVVALSLVPMMGAGLLGKTRKKESRLLGKIQNVYGKFMRRVLDKKALILLAVLVFLVGSIYLAMSRGTAFMPEMESTQISVTLHMPEDATMEETGEMADAVVERFMTIDDVTDAGAMAGGSGMLMSSTGGSEGVSIYLLLKEDKELSNQQLVKAMEEKTEDLDCELDISTSTMDMSALGGSGISVNIKGRELDQLKAIAEEIAVIVESVEGTAEVSSGIQEKTLEMRIVVDKDKASEYGLTTAQVYQFLQAKLADPSSATTLSTDVKDYSVYVSSDKDQQLTREEIKNLTIEGTDKEQKTVDVPLKDIVKFEDTEGFASINREAQSRYVTVSAQIDEGYNIGLVSGDLEAKLADYQVKDGYTIELGGENETINESMTEVMKMMAMALVLMYLIMVAQFQSLLSPFIVMFTVPLAFTGGLLALYLTGSEVSVIAMIGFVMLAGIIVNNGIVLVDYVNQLRLSGMEKREALILAGQTRLRPILMTALTTILGLAGMAVAAGMGSEMMQPMAVVAIGGLIYGTLLTLVVVPCIYDILHRREMKKIQITD